MPRVLGVNIVAWVAAAIVMYLIGGVIYGLAVQKMWQGELLAYLNLADTPQAGAEMDMTEAQQLIAGGEDTTVHMILGGVISLVTALGLAVLLKMVKPKSIGAALTAGFVAWFGFSATTLAFDPVYSFASTTIFAIDLVHTLLTYLAAVAIIFLIDGKALSGEAAAA